MALIRCEHCGHPISDKAPFCPKCGYLRVTAVSEENLKSQENTVPPTSKVPLKTPKGLWAIGIIGLLILAGGIVWLVLDQHSRHEQHLAELEYQRQERLHIEEQQRLEEQRRLETIAAEQARLDSIALEEKMRITPLTIDRGVDVNVLRNLGFIKIIDRESYDEENDIGEWEMKYTRTFNGRRVDYVSWGGGSCDTYFQFFDKQDLNHFKEELRNSKFQLMTDGVYSSGNHWIKIEGNRVRFDFDW